MAREQILKTQLEINLPNRAGLTSPMGTIDTYIGNQAEGSWARYQFREDPNDSSSPFFLRVTISIVVTSRSEAANCMTTIDNALVSLGDVTSLKYEYEEEEIFVGE